MLFRQMHKAMSASQKSRFYALTIVRVISNILDIAALSIIGIITIRLQETETSVQAATIPVVPNWVSSWVQSLSLLDLISCALGFLIVKAIFSLGLMRLGGYWAAEFEAEKSSEGLIRTLGSPTLMDQRSGGGLLANSVLESSNMAFTQTWINFSVAFAELTLIFGISVVLFAQSPWAFLGLALYLGLFGLAVGKYVAGSYEREASAYQGALLKNRLHIEDTVASFRQLFTLGQQDSALAKFRHLKKTETRALYRMAVTASVPRFATELLLVGAIGILIVASNFGGAEFLSLPTVTVFTAGVFRLIGSMMALQSSIGYLKRATVEGKNAFDLLASVVESTEDSPVGSSGTVSSSQHALALDNVSFFYPNRSTPTLVDVDLHIKQNEFVAISGNSGAGKSTLVDILLGLKTPTVGTVQRATALPPNSSRVQNSVGYVPQNVALITGTLAQNVALEWDESKIDEGAVQLALVKAGISSLASDSPDGVHTPLGAGVNEISGGQLQRLGLARALYRKPDLLVLDEVTSSLDERSSREVMATVEKLRDYVTIVMISHKHAELAMAQKVYRLRAGHLRKA